MEVVFSSGALQEVNDAAAFYESKEEGLGKAFLASLAQGVAEIAMFPSASRLIRKNFRRHLLSRFPYSIIFQIREDHVFVAAIMHLKRKPGYWENRQDQPL